MSLLEQDTIRKGRVDKEVRQMKFDADDDENREYKVEAIWDSEVYSREYCNLNWGIYMICHEIQ